MCRQGISGQRRQRTLSPVPKTATARLRSPSSTTGGCCWTMPRSARLHSACQDWGFFQLVNHSVPDDVVEGMKASIQQFFQLPAETKRRFAQQRGRLEGYGQLFVVSEDQKLDWADMLFYCTQPPESRNTELWPDQPASFRSTLDRYASAVKDISDSLVATMAKNLGLKQEVIADRCIGGLQTVRMNYYPPCSQADKVVGLYPHSDADLLTLVLQAPSEPCPRPADQAEWQLASRQARRRRLRRQHWRHLRDLDEREVQEHRAPRGRGPQGEAAVGGGVPLSKHARYDRATEGAYGACRPGRRCL